MQGTVTYINKAVGLFAVLIANNNYSVIEIPETGDIAIGDLISGNLDSLGEKTLKNLAKNEVMSVYIQSIHSTSTNARGVVYR